MDHFTKKNKGTGLLSISCPETKIAEVISAAKADFNRLFCSVKLQLVEFLISSEIESLAGSKHHPLPGYERWGTQNGSV